MTFLDFGARSAERNHVKEKNRGRDGNNGRQEGGRWEKSLRGLSILDSFLIFLCPTPTREDPLAGTPWASSSGGYRIPTALRTALATPHPGFSRLTSCLDDWCPCFWPPSLHIISSAALKSSSRESHCRPFFLRLPVTSPFSLKTKLKPSQWAPSSSLISRLTLFGPSWLLCGSANAAAPHSV